MKKTGRFFQGSGMEDRGWRIGDGGSGMEVQKERGKVGKLPNILRFSAFSGKNILRFSAKGWGWSFHAALQKKLEKQQGTHRCGVDALWFIALSGFREFNRSFNHSKIMHYALKIMY